MSEKKMTGKRTVGNNKSNIMVFRKKWSLNIGIIIFGIVFIYLVATVLMYLTENHISAYEVREGSILKDNAYVGLAIRSESVITAESDGYVNYFAAEGSKVGARTNVYSLSAEKLNFTEAADEVSQELSDEEKNHIFLQMQDFVENFDGARFDDIYLLKNNINAVMENKSNQSRQAQLEEMLASGIGGLSVYRAPSPGVIVYSTDGYEDITLSDVTEEMITKQEYEKTVLRNNSKVKAADPVCKVVTDDTWTLAILLDEETAKSMAETETVEVQFSKDHEMSTAQFSIYNTEGADIGFLTFDSSMVRYAGERYLDIELILEDESGLKIPKSAVIEKEFYTVPEGYLTEGEDGKGRGVLISRGDGDPVFQKADVYYRDNENGIVYLEPHIFEEDTSLVRPDSGEAYRLEEKKPLKGVYNINKGYAVFKQIQVLCESEEYYIVETGNDYGLASYDHIALVGKDVQENDIVF